MIVGRETPGAYSSSLRLASPNRGTWPRPASRGRGGRGQLALAAVDEHEVGQHLEAVLWCPRPVACPAATSELSVVSPLLPAGSSTGMSSAWAPSVRLRSSRAKRRRSVSSMDAKSSLPSTVRMPKMAVVRWPGAAVFEDDHRAHRVGAHGVADVVALDASRRTGEAEALRKIDEQRLGALGVEVVDDAPLAQCAQSVCIVICSCLFVVCFLFCFLFRFVSLSLSLSLFLSLSLSLSLSPPPPPKRTKQNKP